jgi:FdhE protein
MEGMMQEVPASENIVRAFSELYAERARFKAQLPRLADASIPPPDPFRFRQGVPLVSPESLVDLAAAWEKAAGRLIPAMARGFPKIREDLAHLQLALEKGSLDSRRCMRAMLHGDDEDLEEIASGFGIDSQVLKFVLGQFMKPCIEKRAEMLKPFIQDLQWTKGYCPICGTLPELSFIKGEAAEKWLMCALCGHQWRFARMMCPFCENLDPEQMEFFSIVGREHERAELCHMCKRYLVSIELGKRPTEPAVEATSLGMVHMDILAQGRGFLPVAICAWNVVCPSHVSACSGPLTIGKKWKM